MLARLAPAIADFEQADLICSRSVVGSAAEPPPIAAPQLDSVIFSVIILIVEISFH